MSANDIFNINDLAGYLKIPKSTLYKLVQEGRIPAQKVGRHWRFRRQAIDRWLEETRPVPSGSDEALADVVRRLVDAYQPERIYLFGSRARGDAGPDSDYDLLLVVSDDATPERRRSALAYERLWETGVAADVLIWTRTQFDSRVHLRASLPATVIREGKLLHAA